EPRSLNQIHDRANTLTDGRVSFGKRLMNACVRSDHVPHLIVLKANHCIGDLIESTQSFARLRVATSALKRKGKCCERQHQRACLAGEMRHIGGRTRSRAAAESCANKDHSRSAQRLTNFLCRFESSLIAQLRVTTCPQATSDCPAELHFVRSNGTRERLHVRVDRKD